MAITVRWLNEDHNCLVVAYNDFWTLEEFKQTVDISYELMDSVTHTVHIIQDVSHMKGLPRNVLSLAQYTEGRSHPRRGKTYLVSLPMPAAILLDVAKLLAPHATRDFVHTSTLQEAIELLQAQLQRAE
ncbi:MAG: hypothetical protein KC496_06335 [Anaerolineae bacterium]|nr:hypothetical protein [Anaerolineae bacterium]